MLYEISDRLVAMRPRKGGSMHDVHIEAAHHIEQLGKALKRLQLLALDYVAANDEEAAVIEEAQSALVALGDPDASKAEEEYRQWSEYLGFR